jgi:hypothetical protein
MAEAAERKFVNLDELADTQGEETFDPNANQFAFAPPTPGKYLVELSFTEQDPEKRWEVRSYNPTKYPEKEGKTYLSTRLSGRIVEGPFEGRFVNDRFVSTGIFNSGTSTVASILRQAGIDVTPYMNDPHKGLAKAFEQYIAGEPTMYVMVDWTWLGSADNIDPDTGYRKELRGQRHFAEGSYEREDEATGEKIPARAVITGYRGV